MKLKHGDTVIVRRNATVLNIAGEEFVHQAIEIERKVLYCDGHHLIIDIPSGGIYPRQFYRDHEKDLWVNDLGYYIKEPSPAILFQAGELAAVA